MGCLSDYEAKWNLGYISQARDIAGHQSIVGYTQGHPDYLVEGAWGSFYSPSLSYSDPRLSLDIVRVNFHLSEQIYLNYDRAKWK